MKRQRGRGGQRKPGGGGGGGYQPNRAFESNGPDVKVRGPAAHIYEKYMQLARDANSAGDRIQAENYLQHAEHYFRVVRAMQPIAPPPTYNDRYGTDLDFDGEGEDGEGLEGGEAEGGDRPPQQQHQQREREWQPRGEYQQRNRGDYQQRERGEQRGEHQQRDRGEYQQRDQQQPRDHQQPRDQQPREQRAEYEQREHAPPRELQAPREGDEQGEIAASGEEGAEGPRRNRRGRRNRFRPEGEAPRDGGEAQSGPVEGFGDSVPAFVGNE